VQAGRKLSMSLLHKHPRRNARCCAFENKEEEGKQKVGALPHDVSERWGMIPDARAHTTNSSALRTSRDNNMHGSIGIYE
jgi:hypothetical protein